jgi:hypothetical protein
VAVLPVIAGISGDDYEHPSAFFHGFRIALMTCAALLVLGGVISAALIRDPPKARPAAEPDRRHYCGVEGPPIYADRVPSGTGTGRS